MMSGDCDICGEYTHVEASCPNVGVALKELRQYKKLMAEDYLTKEELEDIELTIKFYANLLRAQKRRANKAGNGK